MATFDDDRNKILQYNLTILNTHKQITEKLCVIDVANEFAAFNENRKSMQLLDLQIKESNLRMSG